MKKRILILLLVAAAVVGAYGYDMMVHRRNTEPNAKSDKTTVEPALYTMQELLSGLRLYEEMYDSMTNYSAEKDSGTVVIPGLDGTRTLQSNHGREYVICTSMTPQGMCVTEEYILVSAYCYTHRHNSVIYVIDKATGEFEKEVVLKNKNHVGGLAYDDKNHMIWVSTNKGDLATASCFSLEKLVAYDLEEMLRPMEYDRVYHLHTLEQDSFMAYNSGYLYVGHFTMKEDSVLQKYKIEKGGGLETEPGIDFGIEDHIPLPEEIKLIPERIQGLAIYKNKVILAQSFGWSPSNLYVHTYSDMMHLTELKHTLNKIKLPQKVEQICIDGQDLYVLFESAAHAYRTQPLVKVDRICKLYLGDILTLEIEEK